MLYPCRHGLHLFPSTQKLPVARRSARNTEQILSLFSTFFLSLVNNCICVYPVVFLGVHPSLLLPWASWYIFFSPSPVLQKFFQWHKHHRSEEKKNMVSLFIHKVLSESKSSSEDKTKNLPPQCTNSFSWWTCKASYITGTPLSKSPWKREERWGTGSITWQRKPGLSYTSSVSASWLG